MQVTSACRHRQHSTGTRLTKPPLMPAEATSRLESPRAPPTPPGLGHWLTGGTVAFPAARSATTPATGSFRVWLCVVSCVFVVLLVVFWLCMFGCFGDFRVARGCSSVLRVSGVVLSGVLGVYCGDWSVMGCVGCVAHVLRSFGCLGRPRAILVILGVFCGVFWG